MKKYNNDKNPHKTKNMGVENSARTHSGNNLEGLGRRITEHRSPRPAE